MTLGYRPEIDGLRAIAVTSVILFHSGLIPLTGGFAGVDVFFVISGFLVTSILLREIANGTYSVIRFYERRVRRIFPALAFVLVVTTVAAWLVMIPPQLEAYSKSLLAVLLLVSNFLFGANSGYFSPALEEAPLLHTWSLSIEEQYYLLFPLLLAAVLRRFPGALSWVLWSLALASLALAEWGTRVEPEMNFFFSLSRFWELLAGSIVAIYVHRRPVLPNGPAALAGLALVLGTMLLHGERTPYPSLHSLLPVGGTVLLILFAGPGTVVHRLLTIPPMIGIGLISYSAYLWHQPLFALWRVASTDPPQPIEMLFLVALTYALAYASWRWIEQPFRRPGKTWIALPRVLFLFAALTSFGLLAVGGAGLASKGNDRLWRQANPEQAVTLDLIQEARRDSGLSTSDAPCRFNLTAITQDDVQRIHDCAARYGPAAVVLGDSHALDMFNALTKVSQTPFLLGVANGGCRPAEADKACPFEPFLNLALAQPALFGDILFVQSGAYLLLGPDGREGSRQMFTRAASRKPLPEFGVNAQAIGRIQGYLKALQSSGIPVLWLSPRIEPHVSANVVLRGGCKAELELRPGQTAAFERLDAAVARAAAEAKTGHLGIAAYGFDITNDFMTCDMIFWSDGDHWSARGEARFGARLLPGLPERFQ